MNPTLAGLIGRHLAAENAQDLPGTFATLHPDCRFEDLATGQTWRGHDGAAAHYGNGGRPSTSDEARAGPVVGLTDGDGRHRRGDLARQACRRLASRPPVAPSPAFRGPLCSKMA